MRLKTLSMLILFATEHRQTTGQALIFYRDPDAAGISQKRFMKIRSMAFLV